MPREPEFVLTLSWRDIDAATRNIEDAGALFFMRVCFATPLRTGMAGAPLIARGAVHLR